MMRHSDDPKFLGGDLIDDAVGKSAEKMASSGAAKNCPEHRVRQNEICRSLKLGHECKPKLDIRFRRIENRSIMQLSECERNNDKFHFNAARTCARASVIGIT
jgi:hypothetical protein